MQKELAKKQKAIRRRITIAHKSHAMRLKSRGCSDPIGLLFIQNSSLSLWSVASQCDAPFARSEREGVRPGVSRYCLAGKKMDNQRDHCKQQQNVDQSAGHVEYEKPTQPRKQQNYKQNDEHVTPPVPAD